MGQPIWEKPTPACDRRQKLFEPPRKRFSERGLTPRHTTLLGLVMREFLRTETRMLRFVNFLSRNASVSAVFEALSTQGVATRCVQALQPQAPSSTRIRPNLLHQRDGHASDAAAQVLSVRKGPRRARGVAPRLAPDPRATTAAPARAHALAGKL